MTYEQMTRDELVAELVRRDHAEQAARQRRTELAYRHARKCYAVGKFDDARDYQGLAARTWAKEAA